MGDCPTYGESCSECGAGAYSPCKQMDSEHASAGSGSAFDFPKTVPPWEEELPKDRPASALPHGSDARKNVPLARGLLDYFPAALAEVAKVSKYGNDKHNPGEELHHARGKSTDHADCVLRHLVDRGTIDPDTGMRHSALVAWRALALLQQELEDAGEAPLPRGARLPGADQ